MTSISFSLSSCPFIRHFVLSAGLPVSQSLPPHSAAPLTACLHAPLRLSKPAFTHCCASQSLPSRTAAPLTACLHASLRLSKPAFTHRCASQSLPSRAAAHLYADAPRRPTTASCTPRSETTPLPGRVPIQPLPLPCLRGRFPDIPYSSTACSCEAASAYPRSV